MGVRPPLGLSHYQVKFAATSLYHTSVATLYVINSHVSTSSLTHSAPRVGSEDVSPVGPTTFEFLPPPDSPITISPLVGTVLPGKAGVGPPGGPGGDGGGLARPQRQGHPRAADPASTCLGALAVGTEGTQTPGPPSSWAQRAWSPEGQGVRPLH